MERARFTVRISPNIVTPNRVWRTERAALENICVIGLVTLMLMRLAMQRKKPTRPVTRLPMINVLAGLEPARLASAPKRRSRRIGSSPLRMAMGKRMSTPAAFDHQARAIAELSTVGREDLIQTACRAMNKLDKTP